MELSQEQIKELSTIIFINSADKEELKKGTAKVAEIVKKVPFYFVLSNNQVMINYVRNSANTINNFLTDGVENYNKEGVIDINAPEDSKEINVVKATAITGLKKRLKEEVKNGYLNNYNIKYLPICPAFIKDLIEIDEVLRLSKYWTRPIDIYRATYPLKDAQMLKLNSFSSDIESVMTPYFLKENGTIFMCNLPAHFPRIKKQSTRINNYPEEREIILPPCEFETTKLIGKLKIKQKNIKKFEHAKTQYEIGIKLRPLSLAKVFLERMKNPPADYPKFFLEDPAFEYQKAMEMLEDYVKNYVDKHIIEVNGEIIEELPDPEVVFDSEEYEKNN